MGRPRLPERDRFYTIAISEEAYKFFHHKKGYREPMYRVVDRIIKLYALSDKADLIDKSEKQAKIIDIYYDRIKRLEADKQTKLIE